MEQQQVLVLHKHNAKLDVAACAVTEILSRNGVKHGFFGGYAVSVFGGVRLTHDIDVIVGEDAQGVRQQLLAGDGNFSISEANKLKFRLVDQDIDVVVELLQGGKDKPLKLPDINTAAILLKTPLEVESGRADRQMPFLHPVILFLTKLKRWMHIVESTRPASVSRSRNDQQDMATILQWVVEHGLKINFDMYPEKKKEELLPGIKKLLGVNSPAITDVLKEALFPEDLAAIS